MSYSTIAVRDLYDWGKEQGLSEDYISNRLRLGTVGLRDKWNSGSHDPNTYYSQECQDEYIYDLTAWHGSGTINEWFAVIKSNLQSRRPGRILDYGAGIGTYSLIAAELGWEVDACDINQPNLDYIAWRSKRHGYEINTVQRPSGTYDVMICIDTIEHLPDPLGFPAFAASTLVSRGLAILTWTFHRSGGMHPMHHDEYMVQPFLHALRQKFVQIAESWPTCLEKNQ